MLKSGQRAAGVQAGVWVRCWGRAGGVRSRGSLGQQICLSREWQCGWLGVVVVWCLVTGWWKRSWWRDSAGWCRVVLGGAAGGAAAEAWRAGCVSAGVRVCGYPCEGGGGGGGLMCNVECLGLCVS